MKNSCVRFAVAMIAVWSIRCVAQTAPPARIVPNAEKQLDIGAAEAPLTAEERVDLDKAIRAHKYSDEKAVIDKAVAKYPDSFELLVMWGRVAYLERQPKDAAVALERADKIKALSAEDRMTLALAYQFSQDPAKSRAEFLKLIKLSPGNAQYAYLLGKMDRTNRRLEEAADSFKRAILIDPNFVRAYQELGQTQQALGQDHEARRTYETAVAVNRRQTVHWEWSPLDLGVLLVGEDKFKEAEELFREALQYNPRFAWGHYWLGQLFHKQARDREALEEYKAAVVADPRLREGWLALTREFKRTGNQVEAERSLAFFKKLDEQENAHKAKKN